MGKAHLWKPPKGFGHKSRARVNRKFAWNTSYNRCVYGRYWWNHFYWREPKPRNISLLGFWNFRGISSNKTGDISCKQIEFKHFKNLGFHLQVDDWNLETLVFLWWSPMTFGKRRPSQQHWMLSNLFFSFKFRDKLGVYAHFQANIWSTQSLFPWFPPWNPLVKSQISIVKSPCLMPLRERLDASLRLPKVQGCWWGITRWRIWTDLGTSET